MNIALIGYGRMGHEIEEIAVARGHAVKIIIDKDNISDLNKENLKGIDVAIEFSSPEAAFENISKCLGMKVPVVSGTTGWLKDYDKAAEICRKNNTSFIHSSNFSIGVNLLFRLNAELAKQMSNYKDYSVFIEEIHHTKKMDAPSGTAITLAEGITKQHPGYTGWRFENDIKDNLIPVRSVREGVVPGTHTISWDSTVDTLSLKHEAKNRKGFAVGTVIAAEFIYTRKGVFTMNDILGF
ncbi:MAG: 4-hydroxy-tetrahydrodipicolinate reductase [Bacteroidia bacterium]|nr:4-hydroxy-tetrahydrodipicolinate reductase [Bacteroidia bacterium]